MENNQNNKKGFYSISKGLVFILLGVLIIFLALYIWRFHCGLSSDQLRWSQFGDFFNGVISPIFAAINICIFWYLTKVVDENNAKRQSDKAVQDAELQRQNTELKKELQQQNVELENKLQEKDAELRTNLQQQNEKHEKALILMQFRKAEIDRFEEAFSNALIPSHIEGYDSLHPLFSLLYYLGTFKNTKLDIFDLDEESTTAKNIAKLIEDVSDSTVFVMKNQKTPEDITKSIVELEFSVISDLQKITLGVKNS